MRYAKLIAPLALLVAAACSADSIAAPTVSAFETRPGLTIENAPSVLAARVHDAGGAPVYVVATDQSMPMIVADETSLPFTLQVHIDAPEVNGIALPASHTVFRGTRAFVSYTPAGESFVAAVDVFDISTPWKPELISSARFADSKVTTMAVDGDLLYLGTASSHPKLADQPAAVEVIALDAQGRLTEKSLRLPVSSHVVTGIAVAEKTIWVTSGTSVRSPGGITVFERGSFAPLWRESLFDLRAVSVSGHAVLVLAGSGARMLVYDGSSGKQLDEFKVGGLSELGHKATIATLGSWAFVAAGEEGVAFARIWSGGSVAGEHLRSWGSPAGVPGVADADAVTNAVAVSGAYVYAANGGAGVWVARGAWSTSSREAEPTITPIGRLDLPGVSANMVGVFGGSLFVAAGTGGLKILQQPTP